MTNLSELEKKYEELGQEIERLKSKKKGLWAPKEGEEYWFIGAEYIYSTHFRASKAEDRDSVASGNVFPTKAAAEAEVFRRKATRKILNIIAEERGDWVPAWPGPGVNYYFLCWDHAENSMGRDFWADVQHLPDSHYYPHEALRPIRDRLKSECTTEEIKAFCGVGY